MVPFYGQGMNAGLEDVRVLFTFLDKYYESSNGVEEEVDPDPVKYQRAMALAKYSAFRTKDAAAINDLALQNYTEMRSSVTSPVYRVRKFLEESLSVYVPSLGWKTKYSRVSFGNERYSDVIAQSERQGKLLLRGLVGLVMIPVVIGGIIGWYRWRRAYGSTRGLLKLQTWFRWKTSP